LNFVCPVVPPRNIIPSLNKGYCYSLRVRLAATTMKSRIHGKTASSTTIDDNYHFGAEMDRSSCYGFYVSNPVQPCLVNPTPQLLYNSGLNPGPWRNPQNIGIDAELSPKLLRMHPIELSKYLLFVQEFPPLIRIRHGRNSTAHTTTYSFRNE